MHVPSSLIEQRRSSLPDIHEGRNLILQQEMPSMIGGARGGHSRSMVYGGQAAGSQIEHRNEHSRLLDSYFEMANMGSGQLEAQPKNLNWSTTATKKLIITEQGVDQQLIMKFLKPESLMHTDRSKIRQTKIKLFNSNSPQNKVVLPLQGQPVILNEQRDGHGAPLHRNYGITPNPTISKAK